MITERLMNKNIGSAGSFPILGPTKNIPMPKSYRGVVDVKLTNATGTALNSLVARIQGRLSPEQEFVDVLLNNSNDEFQLNINIPGLTFEDIQLYPEMRVKVISNSFINADLTVFLGH